MFILFVGGLFLSMLGGVCVLGVGLVVGVPEFGVFGFELPALPNRAHCLFDALIETRVFPPFEHIHSFCSMILRVTSELNTCLTLDFLTLRR